MPRLYSNLPGDPQLNEIVMMGSHDGGITGGDVNEKTQSRDIYRQAVAGSRFFDIRVAAQNVPQGAELKTFHAPGGVIGSLSSWNWKTEKSSKDLNRRTEVKTTRYGLGTWGMGLSEILGNARNFVTTYPTEFLILKFDKSNNWRLIAETCHAVLGDALYNGGGNLNTKKISRLSGRVIVLFPGSGMTALIGADRFIQDCGILPWKNLFKPPTAYDPGGVGLQYWGSGGTSVVKPGYFGDDKITQNIKKQSKLMNKAAVGAEKERTRMQKIRRVPKQHVVADPNVVGMMYWTTTGIKESILERNNRMWNATNKPKLQRMWEGAFQGWADNALPQHMDQWTYSSGGVLKTFIPNIVMVDFADWDKGGYIYGLNTVASTSLVDLVQGRQIQALFAD